MPNDNKICEDCLNWHFISFGKAPECKGSYWAGCRIKKRMDELEGIVRRFAELATTDFPVDRQPPLISGLVSVLVKGKFVTATDEEASK
jgi:hypothetical protein